jgi:hypothetical protein
MSKWPVEYVKKDQSMLDTTLENRQRLRFLKESSIHSQNWVHCEQNIIPSHTCLSMSEMTCRTRQETSLESWYNARLSTMIEFSERIIHKRAELRALWAKHHCISYLLDVKMGCQTRQEQTVDSWYNARKTILRNLAGFTALSAIQHSTTHTHTPSQFHRTLIGCSPFVKVNNCQSFYSQFEFWNLAKIILFGCFWLTLLLWLCRHN